MTIVKIKFRTPKIEDVPTRCKENITKLIKYFNHINFLGVYIYNQNIIKLKLNFTLHCMTVYHKAPVSYLKNRVSIFNITIKNIGEGVGSKIDPSSIIWGVTQLLYPK